MAVRAAGSGTAWDDRRNTSQTRAPDTNALRDALASCRALRQRDPALVAWVEEGHPNLTDSEHCRRFGGPYRR